MSHETLAALWERLERRLDIRNIVSEALGHYQLVQSLPERDQAITADWADATLQQLTLLRIVLHLQRVYLQSPAPSAALASYLLNSRDLFSLLSFLLQLKKKICSFSPSIRSHGLLRYLAETVLSGLRALLLRKQKLVEDDALLRRDIGGFLERLRQEQWPTDMGSPRDIFLIRELISGCITQIGFARDLEPTALQDRTQQTRVDLPDYHDGLVWALSSIWSKLKTNTIASQFPLSNDLTPRVKSAMHGLESTKWMDSFWTLYDARSAVLAASIHLFIRTRSSGDRGLGAHQGRAASETQVLNFEKNFWNVFQSGLSSETGNDRLNIVEAVLVSSERFPTCDGRSCCRCFSPETHVRRSFRILRYTLF